MEAFTLSALADEISPDLDEQIRVLKAYKIQHLELRSVEGVGVLDFSSADLESIYQYLVSHGISVSAIASPIGKIGITEDFEPHLDLFRKAIKAAQVCHTNSIRMFSFFIPLGKDPGLFRVEVLRRWAAFVEAARPFGLTLLHENEKEIYGDSADRCLDLLESLACPFVKATFDPANFVQCHEEVYPRAWKMLQKHVAYLHIKDALLADGTVTPVGLGDGRILELLGELKASGYRGFLSIEPHLDNSLPGGGPEMFGVAVRALKEILNKL